MRMRVLAKRALRELWSSRPDARAPLVAWYDDAREAAWTEPGDIKRRYASASFLAGDRMVFNIGRNEYRLVTRVNYAYGVIYIRFVGSHAAYDRIDAETI
jgi:mRNA interferase HigB